MPAVMKLINNLNNINTCFSNGYELRGSMGSRQSQPSNGLVMNGTNSNHLTRSATRNRLKEPLTVECNGFSNSVSVRSDGVLVEKDAPGRLCRSKSKSCPGNGSQLAPLSPTDAVRPRRNIWKLPSCLLGTTAEDSRGRGPNTGSSTHKTDTKSNHSTPSVPCKYHLPTVKTETKIKAETISKLQEDGEERKHHKRDKKFLEDNREYYKLEVLSAKLRSTRQFVKEYEARKSKDEREDEAKTKTERLVLEHNGDVSSGSSQSTGSEVRKTRHSGPDEIYLSRRNLKLRHSRDSPEPGDPGSATPGRKIRHNKITMIERLNMEADKFMFGDPRRELEEQESSPDTAAPKRKRKSQVELFLIDNLDYYKFELPASRLRNGHDVTPHREELDPSPEDCKGTISIDFEDVKYSFEMGIQQELWYQVFLRSRSRTKQSLWQTKVPHQSKILLPFERKTRPSCKVRQSLPPPPPPPELEPILPAMVRRRKRRLSSILEDDSRPRKSPRCHASTQAILSSHPGGGGTNGVGGPSCFLRRSILEEDSSCSSSGGGGDFPSAAASSSAPTPLHEPDHFPECCEFARGNPYSCDVRRLVDKLARQLRLDTSQLNLCEILRQYSRSYYTSLGGGDSASQPGDNSSDCGASSHMSSEGTGGRRSRHKKRRINMTGWPCRPKRKAAGKVINYNENVATSTSSTVPPPSLSPTCATPSPVAMASTPPQKKKSGRKKKAKASNRYKY